MWCSCRLIGWDSLVRPLRRSSCEVGVSKEGVSDSFRISLVKLEGNIPVFPFRNPSHQPSSTWENRNHTCLFFFLFLVFKHKIHVWSAATSWAVEIWSQVPSLSPEFRLNKEKWSSISAPHTDGANSQKTRGQLRLLVPLNQADYFSTIYETTPNTFVFCFFFAPILLIKSTSIRT